MQFKFVIINFVTMSMNILIHTIKIITQIIIQNGSCCCLGKSSSSSVFGKHLPSIESGGLCLL